MVKRLFFCVILLCALFILNNTFINSIHAQDGSLGGSAGGGDLGKDNTGSGDWGSNNDYTNNDPGGNNTDIGNNDFTTSDNPNATVGTDFVDLINNVMGETTGLGQEAGSPGDPGAPSPLSNLNHSVDNSGVTASIL